MLSKILILVLISHLVKCSISEIAKVSLASAQNQEENHKDDNHDVALNSKATNFNLQDAYNKGAKNDYSHENEAGKYDVVNNNNNHHSDNTNYADQKFNQENGGSVSNLNKKVANKKGHHNSGFHNTYHKDESSNKSSFYDDGDEEGGQFAQNSKNGAFGNKQSFNDGGSRSDNAFKLRGHQEAGDYNNGGNLKSNVGTNNKNYNEGFYTDRENLGRVRAGNRHGLASDYYQENLHQQYPNLYYEPPLYDRTIHQNGPRNYNHRVLFNAYNRPEKQTITIYEDPRVYQHSSDYSSYRNPGYHQSNIELNVVPPQRTHSYSNYDSLRPAYEYEY